MLHKDIKPSNILMHTDRQTATSGRVSSDFGIGILTDPQPAGRRGNITEAGFTQLTQPTNRSRTGTRMYAPPETLAGKPFTMQGDVYALGVLLYQMAVGDLERPLAQGWERDVADELLREDIAACVEGDPALRLTSAKELADRLATLSKRRHIARTTTLRSRRFGGGHRIDTAWHRVAAADSRTVIANLAEDASLKADSMRKMFAIDATTRSKRKISPRTRQLAVVEGKKSAAVTDFFQMMLESIDPAIAKGKEVTVKEVLAGPRRVSASNWRINPMSRLRSATPWAACISQLSDHAKAEEHFRWSLDQRTKALGPDDPQTLRTGDALGATLVYMARLDDAETVLQPTFERPGGTLGPEHEDTLTTLGHLSWVYQDRGDLDKAAALTVKPSKPRNARSVLITDKPWKR